VNPHEHHGVAREGDTLFRRKPMTAMPTFKIETTASDFARVGDRVVRVFGSVPCPHCLRRRLHATSMREISQGEFAWTCTACHSDIITISAS
jgi:hypothetical protein